MCTILGVSLQISTFQLVNLFHFDPRRNEGLTQAQSCFRHKTGWVFASEAVQFIAFYLTLLSKTHNGNFYRRLTHEKIRANLNRGDGQFLREEHARPTEQAKQCRNEKRIHRKGATTRFMQRLFKE